MRRHAVRFAVALLVPALLTAGVAGAAPGGTPPGKSAPTNVSRPTISGTAQVGQTLTGSVGTWSGPTPTFAYQWQRCDASGANCTGIDRATAGTYVVASADLGSTLRFAVVASNKNGSTYATSDPTSQVTAATPPPPPPPTTSTSTTSTTTSTSTTSTTTTTPTGSGPCGGLASQTPPTTYAHVVWIWMENKSYGDIIGSSSAPYGNQLAQHCGLATSYFGVSHPSLPNYLAATSGSTWGISDDNPPSSHPLQVSSIFGQIGSSASYEESMPSNCDLTDSYPYAVKHNPEAYYVPVRTACQSKDVPLDAFDANALPAFSFVTPNLCNDMHDCSVATGDAWLQSFIPRILSSADYQAGKTAIFLTWDEDDNSSNNQVPMIVLSEYTAPGTRSGTGFDHYALLRTTEELLGVGFLGGAAAATDMRPSFHL